MRETRCGLWLSPTAVSIRSWFMGYESFSIKQDVTDWMCKNTPDFVMIDDTNNEHPRIVFFQSEEHAALFQEYWNDKVELSPWEPEPSS